MEKTNSNTTDAPYSLVQVSNWPLEGVRFYSVPTVLGFMEWEKILSTGTREEMAALKQLMNAAHGNN